MKKFFKRLIYGRDINHIKPLSKETIDKLVSQSSIFRKLAADANKKKSK